MIYIESIRNGSSGNLYVVRNEDTNILLECGFKLKKILNLLQDVSNPIELYSYDACVISHAHNDHSLGAKEISDYLPIYCNEETATRKHIKKANITAHNRVFTIGSIRVKAIAVNHGECDNLAYIFKDDDNSILFATDFSFCSTNLSNFKFNEIYIECNYDDQTLKKQIDEETDNETKFIRQLNTHMSLEHLIKYLKTFNLSKTDKISLIHLSRFCSNKKIIVEKMQANFPNMEIEFAKGGN